jgi:hypothetical protein
MKRTIVLPVAYTIEVTDNADGSLRVHCDLCGQTWLHVTDHGWPELHAEIHIPKRKRRR